MTTPVSSHARNVPRAFDVEIKATKAALIAAHEAREAQRRELIITPEAVHRYNYRLALRRQAAELKQLATSKVRTFIERVM